MGIKPGLDLCFRIWTDLHGKSKTGGVETTKRLWWAGKFFLKLITNLDALDSSNSWLTPNQIERWEKNKGKLQGTTESGKTVRKAKIFFFHKHAKQW